jgi:hypothetical protein
MMEKVNVKVKVKVNLSLCLTKHYTRFAAFPATEYDEVLSGYQPGQMVEL